MAWSGTARRLGWAFGALVAIFAVASWYALAGLAEIHESLHRMKRHEEGAREALDLAGAVRDERAASAAERERAHARVVQLLKVVRDHVEGGEERAWADDLQRAHAELDGIGAGEPRAAELAALMVERSERLSQRYATSIGGFEEHADAIQHAAFRWTLAFLVGATLFAAAVGIYIGRSIARPVARLEAAAAKLAEGKLEMRVEEEGPEELRRLARGMNGMAAALAEHQRRLVASERLASVGGLAAGVAHEINNPLGVILGYVRVLLRKAEGPLAEDLRIVEEEAVRCQQIVEGLLDLSRPMQLQVGEVDLRALCDEVAARLAEAGKVGAGAIAVEGRGVARGDAGRLRQVVTNLIKNGVEAGGKVVVRVEEGAVVVEDGGPGVKEEERARLFEPFFTTKAGGTGLGLAVSQAIARAHGGAIEVGAREGGGATFRLRLA